MISSNSILFLIGGITFLFVFSWFKDAAIEVFKKELESSQNIKSVWSKLLKVFLVDWLICVMGVLGTGILFVVILNFAH
jgi:flagellar biosynthesis protein FlhB